jgi:hypothetical protein
LILVQRLEKRETAHFTSAQLQFQQEMLVAHKSYRALHCAPSLTLDDTISQSAQSICWSPCWYWSNGSQYNEPNLGENLYTIQSWNSMKTVNGEISTQVNVSIIHSFLSLKLLERQIPGTMKTKTTTFGWHSFRREQVISLKLSGKAQQHSVLELHWATMVALTMSWLSIHRRASIRMDLKKTSSHNNNAKIQKWQHEPFLLIDWVY